MSRTPSRPAPGLPDRQAILDFIATQKTSVGKREIAKAFGLHAQDKIALKGLLKQMMEAGELETGPGRNLHKGVAVGGGIPRVTVVRVADIADGQAIVVPDRWVHPGPAPRLRLIEGRRHSGRGGGAFGLGDRLLARIEEQGSGMLAFPMKALAKSEEHVLGILRRDAGGWRLVPVDKKMRQDLAISDPGEGSVGDLVLAEPSGRPPRITGRVVEVLGDPFLPRAFSLIAIHAKGIPHHFDESTLAEADRVASQPLGNREDLRALPFLTIDPSDARDHDDAVWAAPDPDKPGQFRAIVAIADVSFYVRPGTALDRSARSRGNSVYFPDRVVPMLPEILSAHACSLVENEDRAVMACHLHIGADGKLLSWRFTRALIRCVTNIAYEEAQATMDAGAGPWLPVLQPLWDCWAALKIARDTREPLALELPERRVVIDEAGRIAGIAVREHLTAHQVIEDYMIAANVAAALALEKKKSPCIFRCHEVPSREKLVTLRDYLETMDQPLALGQVVRPAVFNRILARAKGTEHHEDVSQQVLRTQTQAYYSPANVGHFGLALGSYAHFTSPIRRYADLVVHRSLAAAYRLGEGGLHPEEDKGLTKTADHISMTERRAMEAERDTIDRYVASYLSTMVGDVIKTRITGVAKFGFFATVEGLGGDGLVPVSTLGAERFVFDEDARVLEGSETGTRYAVGQRLELRLVEASPITGALRYELPEGGSSSGPRGGRVRRDGNRGFTPRPGQSRVPPGVRRGRK